ncbi:MAG: hypothetical protein ACNA8P_02515 [Phycisphaerales bacterium]
MSKNKVLIVCTFFVTVIMVGVVLSTSDRVGGAEIAPHAVWSPVSYLDDCPFPGQSQPFDHLAAWGVPFSTGEDAVAITIFPLQGAPSNVVTQGGLFCMGDFGAGAGYPGQVIDPDDDGWQFPEPDLTGTLTEAIIVKLPGNGWIQTESLQGLYPGVDGQYTSEFVLVAGYLTSPLGYSEPVTGYALLHEFHFTLPEAGSYFTTSFMAEWQWSCIEDAYAYILDAVVDLGQAESAIVDGTDSIVHQMLAQAILEYTKQYGVTAAEVPSFEQCAETFRQQTAQCVADRNARDSICEAGLERDEKIASAAKTACLSSISWLGNGLDYGVTGAAFGAACGAVAPPVAPATIAKGFVVGGVIGLSVGYLDERRACLATYRADIATAKANHEFCFQQSTALYGSCIAPHDQAFWDCVDAITNP